MAGKLIEKGGLSVRPIQRDRVTAIDGKAGVDATTLPEGHLACAKCGCPRMEAWVYEFLIECGCMKCGHAERLLLPRKMDKLGRFQCRKHNREAVFIIHNSGYLSIGCSKCWRELVIEVKGNNGIIVV